MTLRQLAELYMARYYKVNHPRTHDNEEYFLRTVYRTSLPRANGQAQRLEDWPVAAITVDTLERFKETRVAEGKGRGDYATNRCLGRLRAIFNWAILKGYMDSTPFKVRGVTAVKLLPERRRYRRLEPGEEERLLTACNPNLRALVEAALETACRKGELLSLQWLQVRWEQNELYLPAVKTKSDRDRFIPISKRLRAILEMRQHDAAGEPMPSDAYVFGNEIGQRIQSVKRAWGTACRKAKIEGLRFHDLRREAASRLLEGQVPEHYVQAVLGHADLTTTSKYLATTRKGLHQVFQSYERRSADSTTSATLSDATDQTSGVTGSSATRPL